MRGVASSSSSRRKIAITGAIAVVVLGVGGLVVSGGGDDGAAQGGAVMSSLDGKEVANVDTSDYPEVRPFLGGVLVNGGDQATAYDLAGERLERFGVPMQVGPNGVVFGYDYDSAKFIYWRNGSEAVTTRLPGEPTGYALSAGLLLASVVDDRITVSDVTTGDEVWNGRFDSGPVYSLTWSGKTIAGIDASNELELIEVGSDTPIDMNDRLELSYFVTPQQLGVPSADDSRVLAIDADGDLVSIDPADGSKVWRKSVVTSGDGGVYIEQMQDGLWLGDELVDAKSGDRIWSMPSRYEYCSPWADVMVCGDSDGNQEILPVDDLSAEPVGVTGAVYAVGGDTVFVVDAEDLDAISVVTGKRVWDRPARARNGWRYGIVVTDSQLIASTTDGELVALGRDDGNEISNWDAPVRDILDLISAGDVLIATSTRSDSSYRLHFIE